MAETNPILPYITAQDIQRFWSLCEVGAPNQCWPWKASRGSGGYGRFSLKCGVRWRQIIASRVAYVIGHQADPERMLVCHNCDHPPCCNPSHLFLGTPKENSNDCRDKGRLNTPCGAHHGSKTKPESRARGERAAGARLSADQVIHIREMYLTSQYTHQQIADQFGVLRETISVVLRGENWKHIGHNRESSILVGKENKRLAVIDRNRRCAKLTDDQVRELREDYEVGGESMKDVGTRYGVTASHVCLLVRRKFRDHVV